MIKCGKAGMLWTQFLANNVAMASGVCARCAGPAQMPRQRPHLWVSSRVARVQGSSESNARFRTTAKRLETELLRCGLYAPSAGRLRQIPNDG